MVLVTAQSLGEGHGDQGMIAGLCVQFFNRLEQLVLVLQLHHGEQKDNELT